MSDGIVAAVCEYLNVQYTEKERDIVHDRMKKIEADLGDRKPEKKMDAVQQLLFLNLIGYPTAWGDFSVLDVMAIDTFSAKRVAYVTASQLWHPSSDVVLMATNRIQRDLTSAQALVASVVLSSLPPYLSPILAQHVAGDVIKLMTSSKVNVKQKAIMTFYHVCLHYPDALKPGFPTLRSLLDDPQPGVVFSALAVVHELCLANPKNFVSMIPKLFKMLERRGNDNITLRLTQIMAVLAREEVRLVKRLVEPYTELLQNTGSLSVVYEIARSVVEVPMDDVRLVQETVQRVQSYLHTRDITVRSLFVVQFMGLLQMQPRLCGQYKDLITNCLDSEDENERILALELLSSTANAKNIDKLIGRMLDHFRNAITIRFRNQIIVKVVELCGYNDYERISDFQWYITTLVSFINEGGFTCYDILAEQVLDLAVRVPATRPIISQVAVTLFEANCLYKDAVPLLIACVHVIGNYGADISSVQRLLSVDFTRCTERVQRAVLTAAMRNVILTNSKADAITDKIAGFESSKYLDVQADAVGYVLLANVLRDEEAAGVLKARLAEREECVSDEIEPPEDLHQVNPLLSDLTDGGEIKAESQKDQSNNDRPRKKRHTLGPKEGKEIAQSRKRRGSELNTNIPALPTYLQLIGENSGVRVVVDYVEADGNKLAMYLQITNLTNSPMPSVDICVSDAAGCRPLSVAGHFNTINAGETATHAIEVQSDSPMSPHILKIIISPISSSADPIEARLRIFPSYFCIPTDPSACDPEQCVNEDSLTLSVSIPGRACIERIRRTLPSKMVPNLETKVISMYSATSYGAHLISTFECAAGKATVVVKSSDRSLTESLVREIEMGLTQL